jgi:FixJ family two-component response regulator
MRRPRFHAVVIDDNDGLRKLLVECLLFSDVDAEGFAEAEEFLRRFSPLNQSPTTAVPDLVIVDLELKPRKMQGLELIAALVKRDIASEIVAITGHHSSSTLVENAVCFGAAAIFTKPFGDIWSFVQRLEQIARIGQNRRLSRSAALKREWYDRSRRRRPVFLSYATGDQQIANGIRRNLEVRNVGVWYAPTTLAPGDRWRERIQAGIDEAFVFVPLMTNRFLKSPYCVGELTRFYRRLHDNSRSSLTMLPVLADSSLLGSRNEWVRRILGDYQAIAFAPRALDGLTVLLARVQQLVFPPRPGKAVHRTPPAPLARRGRSRER